jgi:hypothetical protein
MSDRQGERPEHEAPPSPGSRVDDALGGAGEAAADAAATPPASGGTPPESSGAAGGAGGGVTGGGGGTGAGRPGRPGRTRRALHALASEQMAVDATGAEEGETEGGPHYAAVGPGASSHGIGEHLDAPTTDDATAGGATTGDAPTAGGATTAGLAEQAAAARAEAAATHRRPTVMRTVGHVPATQGDDWWRAWFARTGAALLGALALSAALIAAFVGGLHQPTPRDVPVGVIRGDPAAEALMTAIRLNSPSLEAVQYDDRAAAADALDRREVYAVLGATDVGGTLGLALTTAGGSSPAVQDLIDGTIVGAAATVGVPLTVADVVPVSPEDPRGVTPFYLVFGLILGGVLAASALGVALGTVPRDLDRAALRIGALAVFSLLLGLIGAVLVDGVFGIWTDQFLGLTVAGALIAFAAAMITKAVQGWLGLLGTGLVILLLIVLGLPGSGGLVPPEFLPTFFRGMHRWNPPGLGVDLIKSVAYFDRAASGWPITTLTLWALAGVLTLLGATAALGRRAASGQH